MTINKINNLLSKISKPIWNILGSIFASIGVIGVFVPLLPTTPFLLLAAYCFKRGSDRMRAWFEKNKLFNVYLKNYRDKKGMSTWAKINSISIVWITVGISIYFVANIYIRIVLVLVILGVTIHLLRIPLNKE